MKFNLDKSIIDILNTFKMTTDRDQLLAKIANAEKELKEAKELLNKLPSKSAEEKMREIWRSCNNVKYINDCRTYYLDNEPMFQQDFKNKRLYFRYSAVYTVFYNEYKMSGNQIDELVIKVLSEDINCNFLEAGHWFIYNTQTESLCWGI